MGRCHFCIHFNFTNSVMYPLYGLCFFTHRGKKKWKSKKPLTEQFITSLAEKVRRIHVSRQPRGMQHSLFGGPLEKYKSFENFPLIISCILSIWYIKFIYNKLENQSFYMKRIMCGGDPEDRSDVTECAQHRFLGACEKGYDAPVRATYELVIYTLSCGNSYFSVLVVYLTLFEELIKKKRLPRFVWVKVSIDLEIITYIHRIITDFTVH